MAAPNANVWTLELMPHPPLTINTHPHRMVRYRATLEIHELIWTRVLQQKVPDLHKRPLVQLVDRPVVTLHYCPKDNRRRDVDNLVPTSKACLDGLVKARVLTDDTWQLVDHRMPVIHPPNKDLGEAMWLVIEGRP